MEVTVTCPYCNAGPKYMFQGTEIEPDKGYITKCCNRLVVSYLNAETCQILIFKPSSYCAKERGFEGDVSDVLAARYDSQRPHSKFTWIMQSGYTYVVRLVPKFMDLEKAGRPWGLGLAQRFTSQIEAHEFADSVDKFLLQMVKEFNGIPERDSRGSLYSKVSTEGRLIHFPLRAKKVGRKLNNY